MLGLLIAFAILAGPILFLGLLARLVFGRPFLKLDRHESQAVVWIGGLLCLAAYGVYAVLK